MCIYFDEMIYFYIMLITFLYVFFDQIKSTLFIYDSFFLVSKSYELNTWMQVNIIIIEMIHNIINELELYSTSSGQCYYSGNLNKLKQ